MSTQHTCTQCEEVGVIPPNQENGVECWQIRILKQTSAVTWWFGRPIDDWRSGVQTSVETNHKSLKLVFFATDIKVSQMVA